MQVRYKLRELEAPAISVQYSNQYPAYLLRKGHSYAEWHDSCKKKPSRKAEKDLDPRDLGMSHDVPLDWNEDSKIYLSAILANTLASGLGGSGRAYGICAAKCSQCLSSEGGR